MVHCCVPECENHSKKSENRSFHRIPKENATQKAWIARLGIICLHLTTATCAVIISPKIASKKFRS